MNEKKSVEELIESIYVLIDEARKEYELVASRNNKLRNNESIELKKVKEIIEQEPEIKNSSSYSDWSKRKFQQNNNYNKKLVTSDDELIKIYNAKFQEQMKLWIQKNLNPIIEKEFSIFIKNKS